MDLKCFYLTNISKNDQTMGCIKAEKDKASKACIGKLEVFYDCHDLLANFQNTAAFSNCPIWLMFFGSTITIMPIG